MQLEKLINKMIGAITMLSIATLTVFVVLIVVLLFLGLRIYYN